MIVESLELVQEYDEDALGLKREIRWHDRNVHYNEWTILFVLPTSLMCSIDAWVHEFSEATVRKLVMDVDTSLADREVLVSFNGLSIARDISHLIVSLHCISTFCGKTVSASKFEEILRLRR